MFRSRPHRTTNPLPDLDLGHAGLVHNLDNLQRGVQPPQPRSRRGSRRHRHDPLIGYSVEILPYDIGVTMMFLCVDLALFFN